MKDWQNLSAFFPPPSFSSLQSVMERIWLLPPTYPLIPLLYVAVTRLSCFPRLFFFSLFLKWTLSVPIPLQSLFFPGDIFPSAEEEISLFFKMFTLRRTAFEDDLILPVFFFRCTYIGSRPPTIKPTDYFPRQSKPPPFPP